MERVRRRLFERRTEPTVERSSLRRFSMDQKGADSHALGNCHRLEQSIVDEALPEPLALPGPIHAKPR